MLKLDIRCGDQRQPGAPVFAGFEFLNLMTYRFKNIGFGFRAAILPQYPAFTGIEGFLFGGKYKIDPGVGIDSRRRKLAVDFTHHLEGQGTEVRECPVEKGAVLHHLNIYPGAGMPFDFSFADFGISVREYKTDSVLVDIDHFGVNQKKIVAVAYQKALKCVGFNDLLYSGFGCPYTIEPAAAAYSWIDISGDGPFEFCMPEAGTYGPILKIDQIQNVDKLLPGADFSAADSSFPCG
jgi:hypothetical protein